MEALKVLQALLPLGVLFGEVHDELFGDALRDLVEQELGIGIHDSGGGCLLFGSVSLNSKR